MFVPEQRRELGNEAAREGRRFEIIFCPQSFVLVLSFPRSDNINPTFKMCDFVSSSGPFFSLFLSCQVGSECWLHSEQPGLP